MRTRLQLFVLVLALSLSFTSAACAIPTYDVVSIGPQIPGATAGAATAVNESGDVAGYVSIVSAWEHTAFVYTDELGPILLSSPPWAVTARALDLSNRLADGTVHVVGWAANSIYSGDLAMAWRVSLVDGTVLETIELGTLPGLVQSQAKAVNTLGDCVGYSGGFMQFGGPATWFHAEGPRRLESLYTAVAVNESRLVLTGGVFNGTSSFTHDLNTGSQTDLGVPTGFVSAYGTDINELGQVAGTIATGDTDPLGQYIKQAWRFTEGVGWEYLFGGGNALDAAYGINNHGDVIGQLLAGLTYVDILYLEETGVSYPVESLFADSNVEVSGLNDINDARQLAPSGPGGPVLLTPTASTSVEPHQVGSTGDLDLVSLPNPSRQVTTIRYTIPSASGVTLRVYDAAGRLVRALVDQSALTAGERSVTWDGRDTSGQHVAAGVYLVRLEAAGDRKTERIVRIR
jgi:hypothetical protein